MCKELLDAYLYYMCIVLYQIFVILLCKCIFCFCSYVSVRFQECAASTIIAHSAVPAARLPSPTTHSSVSDSFTQIRDDASFIDLGLSQK